MDSLAAAAAMVDKRPDLHGVRLTVQRSIAPITSALPRTFALPKTSVLQTLLLYKSMYGEVPSPPDIPIITSMDENKKRVFCDNMLYPSSTSPPS